MKPARSPVWGLTSRRPLKRARVTCALIALLCCGSVAHADDGEGTKSIREQLVARFEEQKHIHVSFDLELRPGDPPNMKALSGIVELFRKDEAFGLFYSVKREGVQQETWCAADRSRIVVASNGELKAALPGPGLVAVVVDKLQSEVDRICSDSGIPTVTISPKKTIVRIVIDEIARDRVRFRAGLGIGGRSSASWLQRDFFERKTVTSTRPEVVLTSIRARMSIDPATGLLVEARARKAGNGAELALVRRSKVSITQEKWLSKIRATLKTPGAASTVVMTDRALRGGLLQEGLAKIVREAPTKFKSYEKRQEVAEALARVVLRSKSALADVRAFVVSQQESERPRSSARSALVKLWSEPHQPDADETAWRIGAVVRAVLSRHAGILFDQQWPPDGG